VVVVVVVVVVVAVVVVVVVVKLVVAAAGFSLTHCASGKLRMHARCGRVVLGMHRDRDADL
jgi:hypothetical protein